MPQQEMKPSYGSAQTPSLDKLRSNMNDKLLEASVAIQAYRKASSPTLVKTVTENEINDAIQFFLGAPGELCDSCNGSGRKK